MIKFTDMDLYQYKDLRFGITTVARGSECNDVNHTNCLSLEFLTVGLMAVDLVTVGVVTVGFVTVGLMTVRLMAVLNFSVRHSSHSWFPAVVKNI